MGTTYRAANIGTKAAGSFINVVIPATTQVNDLLIAWVGGQNPTNVTTPAGWTVLTITGLYRVRVFWRRAQAGDAGASVTLTFAASVNSSIGCIAAYPQTLASPFDGARLDLTSTSGITTGSLTTTRSNDLIIEFGLTQDGVDGGAGYTTYPATNRKAATVAYLGAVLCDQVQVAAGATPAQTFTGTGRDQEIVTLAIAGNTPPNAPTLNSPYSGATINRAVIQRLAWTFSDPDAGESQSKADVQYRCGSGALVSITVDANSFWDAPAGTFAPGPVEGWVRTYDALGLVGPWSASLIFTAADTPGVPLITAPISGSTIGTSTATVSWSTSAQTVYQVRKVADNAGAADTSTVYYDSGGVTDSTTRSVTVAFGTNNRWEHIQVRVWADELWSSWADCRVHVSWTPPMTPTVTATTYPESASISIAVTNPTPTEGVPAAAYNDIYVSSPTDPEYRAVTQLAMNSSWLWRGPASGRTYWIRVVAVGTNGTTATSDDMTVIDGGAPTFTTDITIDGGAP